MDLPNIFIGVLVYIRKEGRYLMLHRIKKNNDMHEGFWVAPGGKRMLNESITDCAKREVLEETGLTVHSMRHLGFLHFPDDGQSPFKGEWIDFVFLCEDFSGEIINDCAEGSLSWIDENVLMTLPMWQGDLVFTPFVISGKRFTAQFIYHGKELYHSSIAEMP